MQDNVIWEVFVIQIVSIIVLIGLIIFFLRLSTAIRYEKRISKFSLTSIKDNEKSYFDRFHDFAWKVLRHFSHILSKSIVLTNYGKRYEKHITYDEKEFKSGLDYVSMKILLACLFTFLNIITIMFQYVNLNVFSLLLTFIIGFYLPDIALNIQFMKKRKRVADDLLKAIIIMNNAFKSGRNIMQAIEIVRDELDGPISDEFKKIYLDITYGLSIEVVFNRFYERVKLEDAKYITSSLTLLNKTGGNIVKVFSMIEKSFFDKKKLQNELNSLTASSVFVYRLLISLPFIFAFIIILLNPSYFAPLYTTTLGYIASVLIVSIYISYVLIIRKVLKVEL